MTYTTRSYPHPYRRSGRREAWCQHCPKFIVEIEPNHVWVDDDGFTYCTKNVPHKPLNAAQR